MILEPGKFLFTGSVPELFYQRKREILMNAFKRIMKPKERAITLNGLLQLSHMQRHVICWTLMAETVRRIGGLGVGGGVSRFQNHWVAPR